VNLTRRAESLNELVIATTTETSDDAIEDFCGSRGWFCSRGSRDDVLDRYRQAAQAYNADVIVRITSDCPLIDPTVVDRVVMEFLGRQPGIDYASNVFPTRTYPRGLDTEVMSFDALKRAWTEDRDSATREHVTPYIQRHPDRFRIHSVACETDHSNLRWTVDTPEDFRFAGCVYDHFGNDQFTWCEVLSVLEQHPEWSSINRHVRQKTV
jgi:spore coat polysaccharide biosynthesis protein SpsF